MDETSSIRYTREEILSYLPTGWNLFDPAETGAWDAAETVWRLRVRDGAGVDWQVEVQPSEARELGRLEALRRSLAEIARRGLG